jgi:hypothetical protein
MQIKGFSGLVCVNEGQYMSSGSNEHQTNNSGRRSPALIVLAVLLFAEALGLAAESPSSRWLSEQRPSCSR